MTEDKECRQMESCPYCAGVLIPFGSDFAHPVNDCWLSAVKIMPHEFERWNRRAAKPAVPEVLFDGYAVLQAMSEKARARTSPENVSDVLDAAVKLIRAAAPPLPVVQGWISVKDRLPDDGQTVAFVVDCKNPNWDHLHGRVLGGLYLGTKNGGFSVPGLTVNASHWMPLPAAPTPPAAPKEPTTDAGGEG